jgi:hypothetical protein
MVDFLFTLWPWLGLGLMALSVLPLIGMAFGMRGDLRVVLGLFVAGLGICAAYTLFFLAVISSIGS